MFQAEETVDAGTVRGGEKEEGAWYAWCGEGGRRAG